MAGDADGAAGDARTAVQATNDHDLEALVDCFALGLPQRDAGPPGPRLRRAGRRCGGTGSRSSRFVPDVTRRRRAVAIDGDTVWSEWEMRGTRRDGSAHLMRGVILFGVSDGRASLGALLPRAGRREHGRRRRRGAAPGHAATRRTAVILVAGGTGTLGTRSSGACRPRPRRPRADPRPGTGTPVADLGVEVVEGDVRDRASLDAGDDGRRHGGVGRPGLRRPGTRVARLGRPRRQHQPDRRRGARGRGGRA